MARRFKMPAIRECSREENLRFEKTENEINRIWEKVESILKAQVTEDTATEETEETSDVTVLQPTGGTVGVGTTSPVGTFDVAPGSTGGYFLEAAEATANLTGASTVIQVNVPAGSKVLGCELRVDKGVSGDGGAATWSAAYSGGLTQSIKTGRSFKKNTKVKSHYDEHAATAIAASEVDVTITPNVGTFRGGVIRAILYYAGFTTMTSV